MNISTDIFVTSCVRWKRDVSLLSKEPLSVLSFVSKKDSALLDYFFSNVKGEEWSQSQDCRSWIVFLLVLSFKGLYWVIHSHAKRCIFMAVKHRTCCSQASLPLYYESPVWTSHLFPVLYFAKSVIFIIFLKGSSLFLASFIFSHGSSMDLTNLTSSEILYS